MTDQATNTTESSGSVAVAERSEAPSVSSAREKQRLKAERRDRLWLPLLLPVGSILLVAFVVLNISRLLLTSGADGSVLVGTLLTVGILVVAVVIAASPRIRTTPLWAMSAGALIIVLAIGTLSVGPAGEKKEEAAGFVEPTGPADAVLSVTALSSLKFDQSEYSTSAGILDIKYLNGGGQHTLLFTDAKLAGFVLAVGPPEETSGKVELAEGTYTFFCSIPGHRAAGMQADIVVTAAAPGAATGSTGSTGSNGSTEMTETTG
jgi:plastocyanin